MGHPAKVVTHKATNGVGLVALEEGVKERIELFKGGEGLYPKAINLMRDRHDVVFLLLNVVLIFDVAHDLFEDIFNCDEAGHTAVFIDHDGNVISVSGTVIGPKRHEKIIGINKGREAIKGKLYGLFNKDPYHTPETLWDHRPVKWDRRIFGNKVTLANGNVITQDEYEQGGFGSIWPWGGKIPSQKDRDKLEPLIKEAKRRAKQ